MTGNDLRLWRRGFCWRRERAALELGVSLRTYKDYENASELKRSIHLATIALSLKDLLPVLQNTNTNRETMLNLLGEMTREI
ncbi:XRE family transcriptional regulator [Enterobacteriaceae bacterium H11S18]|uniref:XRE family transcriptional regulator n=1 Tax=Dryocola clanedunensis TaxID=2925396 RepID=UPI0022F124DA|nr:XRE family transcriptional regulator [Dryocola clanedunensis]MCT4709197.1 XRE family transcriptional regulator [Dryocola clanedunensis]